MASPGRKRVTPSPTASTSPARSLPRMSGNEWRISALTPPSRIFEVDGVNAGGAHLDQEVAGPGRRLGQVDDGDRLFVAADGGGFHGGDSLSRKPPKLAANRAVETLPGAARRDRYAVDDHRRRERHRQAAPRVSRL